MNRKIDFLFCFTVILGTDLVFCKKFAKNNEKNSKDSTWEQDLSDAFNIEPSTQGLQKVHLKCGANSMLVQLETDNDFEGVMYTKGSFYDQAEPCFVKPKGKSSRSLLMRFPLDKCQTVQDGDLYSNIVIVQHDPDLVTPGDAAFALECDFRKPRSINVGASMKARDRSVMGSRITVTSPDPSYTSGTGDTELPQNTVYSESNSVTFDPKTHMKTQKIQGTVEKITLKPRIGDEL